MSKNYIDIDDFKDIVSSRYAILPAMLDTEELDNKVAEAKKHTLYNLGFLQEFPGLDTASPGYIENYAINKLTGGQSQDPSNNTQGVGMETGNAPWMGIAKIELASHISEVSNLARINEYLKTVGLNHGDETAWCSAFVNWIMGHAGIKGSGSGLARSWLNWGVSTKERYGAIVVFSRGSGGHVGFFTGRDEKGRILLLGGNQSDAVTISHRTDNLVLGYRWPK